MDNSSLLGVICSHMPSPFAFFLFAQYNLSLCHILSLVWAAVWHVWWGITWRHFHALHWSSISHDERPCEQFPPWKHLAQHLRMKGEGFGKNEETGKWAQHQFSKSAALLERLWEMMDDWYHSQVSFIP